MALLLRDGRQGPLAALPSKAGAATSEATPGASSASVSAAASSAGVAGASPAATFLGLADGAMTGSALPAASGGSSFVADGLGSVASVLSGGSVSAAYSYSPWGEASGAGELPFFGYNSEEHAGGGTGLQYLRARFYDAVSAAFPTADSYLGDPSDPSTLNRYAYCGGNPVAFSDPSGNERFSSTAQRNSWLKNNSAAAKKRQAAAQSARSSAAMSKAKSYASAARWSAMAAVPGMSAVARAAKASTGVRALQAATTRAALSALSAVPGVGAAAKAAKSAAGLGGGDGWTRVAAPPDKGTSSGGLFGAVGDFFSGAVSYASRQVQAVRDHVCGAAERIADQLGFDLPDLSDVAHGALDIIGFWPGVGVGADILNGFLYAAEGNWGDAAASFVGAIPVFGDGVKAGYMGVKAGKSLGKMAGAFLAADATDILRTAKKASGTPNASKLLPGSDLREVTTFNKAGTLRREVHEDGTVDLVLKRKDVWDEDQIKQANKKADILTEYDTVKTEVGERDKTLRKKFEEVFGTKLPEGFDVDHIVDLQLGGLDALSNLWLLDKSVNRSMGAQISILIKDLPPGTKIGSVRFE